MMTIMIMMVMMMMMAMKVLYLRGLKGIQSLNNVTKDTTVTTGDGVLFPNQCTFKLRERDILDNLGYFVANFCHFGLHSTDLYSAVVAVQEVTNIRYDCDIESRGKERAR